jgi:hypothetical protein
MAWKLKLTMESPKPTAFPALVGIALTPFYQVDKVKMVVCGLPRLPTILNVPVV